MRRDFMPEEDSPSMTATEVIVVEEDGALLLDEHGRPIRRPRKVGFQIPEKKHG